MRNFVSILLILAVVPLMVWMPGAIGQSVTTVTSASTVTTQATFTQETQYPAGTATVTSMISESILEGTFGMGGLGVNLCDLLRPVSFDAMQGDQVKGAIQSSNPNSLTLYILSDQQYKIWSSARYCDPAEAGASVLVDAGGVTSYVLAWKVPADGTYWLAVEVYSQKVSVVIASIAKTTASLVTSTYYSTQSSLVVLAATRTLTSILTQALETAPASIDTITIAAVGIVVLVALVGAYFVLSRRKPKT